MHRDESPVSRSTGERSTIAQDRLYAEKMAAVLADDRGVHWADNRRENDEDAAVPVVKDQTNDSADPPAGSSEVIFKLRDGIELLDRCIGMHHIVVLNDKRVGKFYHLGGHEADVLSLMNGELSVAEIAESLQRDGIPWGAEDVQGWALMLAKSGLAVSVDRAGNPVAAGSPPPAIPSDVAAQKEPTRPQSNAAIQKAIGPLGHVISQRIPITSADPIAAWMLPVIGRLFTYTGGIIWLVAVAVSLGLAWTHSHSLGIELQKMFSPAALPLLAAIWVVQKAVHEIGHAVAAKRAGVRVGKFGITFFLFAPIPYVDVTDAWRLSRVWSRVQIALAGVYLEGWTAIVATFAFVLLPDGLGKHLAAQWMMMAGPATWLVNANPLMKMDGYYALADAINIPNLRMHGRNFWASILDRVLLGLALRQCLLVGWRRWVAAIHSAASIVFQAAWMSGLIIAVSQWGGPTGLVVTVVAVILWCAAPVGMWFYGHWVASKEPESQDRRPRLAATAVLAITLVVIGLNASSPFRRSVPVMVQYRDEQTVRAPAAGFVAKVSVQSGQWVKKGELLLVIQDDDLVLRRDQMKDELEVAISKGRQLSHRGELGAAEAQSETIRSLIVSLAELDESIAQLQPTASRSGIVVSPHAERMIGRHVQKGDVLLRVADPSDKELLVVFPEDEWSAYSRVFSAGNSLPVRLRGGYRVSVKPLPARPRFSDRLPNPSFAGSGGGDIPVIADPDADGGFRAAFPVGEAVAEITPIDSKRVLSGQRGRLYLGDTRTIAQRLWLHLGGE